MQTETKKRIVISICLGDFLRHTQRDEANALLYGIEDGDAILAERYRSSLAALDFYRDELVELRDHACYFDDNDYCPVCGADGRA